MPTFLETLRSGYDRAIAPHAAVLRRILVSVLVLLCASMLIEVFVCNFRFFTSATNEPIDLADKINLQQTDDGRFVISESGTPIEIQGINAPVNNIFVKLSKHQNGQRFDLKINFTDSGHSTYFDTTEYTVGVPEVALSTASTRSQYFSLHTTGNVGNIKLQVTGDDVSYPIYIDTIYVNANYPFEFVTWRFLAIFVILLLVLLFRPGSRVYKIRIREHVRFCKVVAVCVVAVQAIVLSGYLLLGSNLVGVATENYNYGE